MKTRRPNLDQIFTPAELDEMTNIIAASIRRTYVNHVDAEDAKGWAALAIVEAHATCDVRDFTEPAAIKKWVRGWCIKKGIWLASDMMREAGVVDRKQNGIIVKHRIEASTGHEMGTMKDPLNGHAFDWIATQDQFESIADQMTWMEQEIYRFHYVCHLPMKVIGVVLMMSESRISQMHSAMVVRLQRIFGVHREQFHTQHRQAGRESTAVRSDQDQERDSGRRQGRTGHVDCLERHRPDRAKHRRPKRQRSDKRRDHGGRRAGHRPAKADAQ